MNNFKQRAVTALFFAAAMIFCLLNGQWTFLAVLMAILILGVFEFYKLIRSESVDPQTYSGVIISLSIFIISLMVMRYDWNITRFLFIAPLVTSVFIMELYRHRQHPFLNIAVTLGGMFYLTLPVVTMMMIGFGFNSNLMTSQEHYSGTIIMGMILCLWASDTGAYLIGSKFGKTKLFERISPNKTWEGFFGGMLFSCFAAYLNEQLFGLMSLTDWLVVAVITVVTGTLGDLVESMLKRSVNVKDSGNLLPGHGGILDRFDGLLVSAPFVCFYLWVAGYLY